MSRLARASGVMAAGTLLSRVTGLARDIVLTAALGLGVFADTFQVANTVPNILYILVVGGALNAVFLPQLVRHSKQDADGGDAYAQRLLTLVALVLAVLSLLAVLAAPLLVGLYATGRWAAADTSAAVAFARYCLPQILCYGLFTMLSQVLNARGHFAAPAFAPVLNNVVAIGTGLAFIVATRDVDPVTSAAVSGGEVALLGIGTTLGIAVQALCLLPVLRRTGFRWRLRLDVRSAGLGRAGDLAVWTILYVLVSQVGYALIVRLATEAAVLTSGDAGGEAGYATYSKAHLVFLLAHSVITVSVVTAAFPGLSAAASDGELGRVRDLLSSAVRLLGVAIVPAAVLLAVLGPVVGITLFGVGRAGADSARLLGVTVAVFAPGLVPYCLFYALNRGFYALEDTRTPLLGNVAVQAVFVATGYLLFDLAPDRWRVPALAAAHGLGYVAGCAVSVLALRRRLPGLDGARITRSYLRLLLASLVGALVAGAVLAGAGALLPGPWPAAAAAAVGGGGAGLLVALVTARRLRVTEVSELVGALRGRSATRG